MRISERARVELEKQRIRQEALDMEAANSNKDTIVFQYRNKCTDAYDERRETYERELRNQREERDIEAKSRALRDRERIQAAYENRLKDEEFS